MSSKRENIRYSKMAMSSWGTNYLYRSTPWSVAWWSAALPGFGHLYLGLYVKGLIFMSGEILINLKANLNLSIYYTFIGDFDKATSVFNELWGLFYIAVWVFAIYDSYRLSIEINKLCALEEVQKKRYFKRMSISSFGINALEQRPPVMSAFFSTIVMGMGQVYNTHFLKGFVLLGWAIAINHYSQLNILLQRFFLGEEIILEQINWEWLLFFPSIFVFSIWDSYVCCKEINNLFIEEQRYYFEKNKKVRFLSERAIYPMYLFGTVKASASLELIINSLKIGDINYHEVIFLDDISNVKRRGKEKIDGVSNFNGSMCGATVLMLFGTMWGGTFIPGGPIAVGLAGFVLGALIGYLLDRYFMGWVRNDSIDEEVLFLVKVNNKEEYEYVTKVFSERNISHIGKVEGETLKKLVS